MRILLIEDDAADAKATRRILRTAFSDASVDWLSDGQPKDAERIAKAGYDCLVLDSQLPSTLGIELAEQLHTREIQEIAIVMLIGNGEEQTARDALETGVENYLRKDEVTPDLLRWAVLGAVERVHLRRQVEEYQRQVEHLALCDALTDLGNWASFHASFDRLLAAAQRRGDGVGLLLIDLDRFKAVNDTYGHYVGDRLLKEVAQVLTGLVRRADMLFRLNGDEFAILVDTGVDAEGLCGLGQRIITTIGEPILVDQDVVRMGASIGISLFPGHGTDASILMSQAETAMNEAKQKGRECRMAS